MGHYFFAAGSVQSIEIITSVCLSVCLSACLLSYLENHTSKVHQMFQYIIPAAVARSSSDGNATRYVLQVWG